MQLRYMGTTINQLYLHVSRHKMEPDKVYRIIALNEIEI